MRHPMYRCPDCGARLWATTEGRDICQNCRRRDEPPADEVPGGLTGRLIDDHVRFTVHAENRWQQRAPIGAVEPEDAWQLAVEVPSEKCEEITTLEGETPDRARVFRGRAAGQAQFSMVFICVDEPNPYDPDDDPEAAEAWTNVVTCYLADSVTDPDLQMYFESLAYQQGLIA